MNNKVITVIPYDEIKESNCKIKLNLGQYQSDEGMPLYSFEDIEYVGDEKSDNYLIEGDCIHTCAWLKNNNIQIDLVYIDPPFFSGGIYKSKIYLRGKPKSEDAIEMLAYNDKWMMEEYLNWIKNCLRAIYSVMSENASIYVHLDWHICHYVKIIMDEIFGQDNFINEIIWAYKSGGASRKSFSKKHDSIYLYVKNKGKQIFNVQKEKSYNRGFKPYKFKGVKEYEDDQGWYTLVNQKDMWQIDMVGRTSKERVDYSTQKPIALLERIILASSNEGMRVADFFGGSGVTAVAAAKNNRKYIHCDLSQKSIQVTRDRLKKQKESFIIKKSRYNNQKEETGRIKFSIEELLGQYLIKILKYENYSTESIINKKRSKNLSSSKIELIERIAVSYGENEKLWHSDEEIIINKQNEIIYNEKETKKEWNGEIILSKIPNRVKIRDICGEETIIEIK